ncbi:MAG TPA: orotate phosphoribosyltransferase [Desulfosalsimonadaceae bacterium]|nr:orotate phosphoribosyltransferase [Desulfosalsimonadaceae bacterium]
MTDRDQLIGLIRQRSFQYSKEPVFTLASGKKSSFYFNLKGVTYYPPSIVLIGTLMYDRIQALDLAPKGIGGLTMGADPIAIAVAYTSQLRENPIDAFSVRKEPKAHGLRLPIEGNVQPGDPVIIIEDVVTTGGSTIKAINAVRDYGLEILSVIALLDRCEQNGRENIEACGVKMDSLLTINDFINEAPA